MVALLAVMVNVEEVIVVVASVEDFAGSTFPTRSVAML
jgi:hypothetical protein